LRLKTTISKKRQKNATKNHHWFLVTFGGFKSLLVVFSNGGF